MAKAGTAAGSAAGLLPAKVRVVRCPKCQKLLQELAGYTVYRCGGCGTTLQAKQAISLIDASSDKSDEEKFLVVENPECCSGRDGMISSSSLENVHESGKTGYRGNQWMDAGNTRSINLKGASKLPDQTRSDGLVGDSRLEDRHMASPKAPAIILNGSVGEVVKPSMDGIVKSRVEENTQNKLQGERAYMSRKVQTSPVFEDEEMGELEVLRRPRTLLEDGRLSPYPYEGPSTRCPYPLVDHRNDTPLKHQKIDRSDRVESLEQDRGDLLRKLDALREQLSRSCDIKGRSNERVTMNGTADSNPHGRETQGSWLEGSSMNMPTSGHFSLSNGHNRGMQNFYPPTHVQNEVLECGDPLESQQLKGAPIHLSHQYPQRVTDCYMYGHFEPDPTVSYCQNVFHHQPGKHWQAFIHDAPSVSTISGQGDPYLVNGHGLYPVGNPVVLGSSNYNHRGTNRPLYPHKSQIWQKPVLAKRNGHSCKPISGGAPFMSCNNCNELLLVPHKFASVVKDHYKLRCGSCSHVILFKIEGKRFDISSSPLVLNRSLEPSDNSSDAIAVAQSLQCPVPSSHTHINFCTGEYGGSACNEQSPDEKLDFSSLPSASHEIIENKYGLNFTESENLLGLSLSPSSSNDHDSTRSMVCQIEGPNSIDLQPNAQASPCGSGLLLRENFHCLSSDQAASRPVERSRSKHFDQDKMIVASTNFKQNSIKDGSITTETDFPADKYPKTALTQDSVVISKVDDHCSMNKGNDSFFTGLIKRSFRDLHRVNQSLESNKPKVVINGHHIPDRLVKKAEKLAGPIYPGEYWYDYTAGFWGIMGYPCIGIIPPFIEEFNYHMPKNCSAGNTGVTVNGRELHQEDLELLVRRGLPPDSDRSYCIDIAGGVLDEISGEELGSLGKLAPTVEKLKHGLGLWMPTVLPAC